MARSSHRPRQQFRNVSLQTVVGRDADGVLHATFLQSFVREIASLAFSDIADYVRDDGTIDWPLIKSLPRHKRVAIQKLIVDTTGGSGDGERKQVIRTTLKLVNKTQPLELLMRHLGMLQEKIEIHHRITLERVLEARNRAMPKSRTAISL